MIKANETHVLRPTEQFNLDTLNAIIGICENRCGEFINRECNIDYQLYRTIREKAESVLCNLNTDIKERNEQFSNDDNDKSDCESFPTGVISEMAKDAAEHYSQWKIKCFDDYQHLKELIIANGGVDNVNNYDLNEKQILYKRWVAEDVEEERVVKAVGQPMDKGTTMVNGFLSVGLKKMHDDRETRIEEYENWKQDNLLEYVKLMYLILDNRPIDNPVHQNYFQYVKDELDNDDFNYTYCENRGFYDNIKSEIKEKGILGLDDHYYKDWKFKFLYHIEQELKEEYVIFKHSKEGTRMIKDFYEPSFSISDYSDEALDWIPWTSRTLKEKK